MLIPLPSNVRREVGVASKEWREIFRRVRGYKSVVRVHSSWSSTRLTQKFVVCSLEYMLFYWPFYERGV